MPASWKTGKLSESDLVAFVRYDYVDTQAKLPEDSSINIFESLVSHRNKSQKLSSNTQVHLGLGLYLVQLIAKFHNANINARNIDNGVEFTITLPIKK